MALLSEDFKHGSPGAFTSVGSFDGGLVVAQHYVNPSGAEPDLPESAVHVYYDGSGSAGARLYLESPEPEIAVTMTITMPDMLNWGMLNSGSGHFNLLTLYDTNYNTIRVNMHRHSSKGWPELNVEDDNENWAGGEYTTPLEITFDVQMLCTASQVLLTYGDGAGPRHVPTQFGHGGALIREVRVGTSFAQEPFPEWYFTNVVISNDPNNPRRPWGGRFRRPITAWR